MEYHEQLGLSRESFEEAEPRFHTRSYEGTVYRHLPDPWRSLDRGTALVEGVAVTGFPKIPRTLVLETGVPAQFDGPIAVEEKLNGYNVRVVRIDGRVLAFTRSGVVCPYTTAKVERLLAPGLEAFFDDHPGLMVCGEMAGPENPYTTYDYPEIASVDFFVFDLRERTTGTPRPVAERRERCAEYGFEQVPLLGVYDVAEATRRVPERVRDLDARNREGVVMKAVDGDRQLKYTTSHANQANLAFAFSLPFDYGQDFMFRRIVREAFQAVEWGEDDRAVERRAQDLGEAILGSMVDTVRDVADDVDVGERHTVRADPAVVSALLAHLREFGLKLVVESDETVDGERAVTFLKRTQKTNDRTRAYLDGKIVRE